MSAQVQPSTTSYLATLYRVDAQGRLEIMPTYIVNRLPPQALRIMHAAPERHHGAFTPKSVHSDPVSKSPLTIASATAAIRSGFDKFLHLFNRIHSTKPVVESVVLVSYRALSERTEEKKHQLIGKSVHPAIAEATMHAVRYDGVGRVMGFTETATDADIELIEQNLIVPLHQTPTATVPNRNRTPAEAVIALAVLVQRVVPDSPEKDNVARSLKENFLSGKTTLDTRATLFTQLLLNPALRALSPEIRAIMGSINHVPHATVVNDNYYGRLFDSALARYVVEHPAPDMPYPTLSTSFPIWPDAVDHAYDTVLVAAAGLAAADGRVRPT